MFFDKIALVMLDSVVENPGHLFGRFSGTSKEDLINLRDQSIIFDPGLPHPNEVENNSYLKNEFSNVIDYLTFLESIKADSRVKGNALKSLYNGPSDFNDDVRSKAIDLGNAFRKELSARSALHESLARACNAWLSETKGIPSGFLAWRLNNEQLPYVGGQDQILSIILKEIPVPNDSTHWEDILNFRADEGSIRKMKALRDWINEIENDNLPPYAVAEKIDHLIEEYKEHLKIHNIKTESGIYRVFIKIGKITENIFQFRFSEALKELLHFSDHNVALMEAERNAPGRELSYIIHAIKHFNQ
jgi:hypothetical protein